MRRRTSALAIAVIEAAFFGLLMATIGEAVLDGAGELATEVAAIDLLPLTTWADEEHSAARLAREKSIAEKEPDNHQRCESRSGWTAETEDGKMRPN